MFGSWNICRGLSAKLNEIRQVMEAKTIDVLFLQEIDLLNFSSEMVAMPGFVAFVDNGIKKRSCTLVRQSVFENIRQFNCCDDLPQVWLEVTENNGRKTTLVNVYREWGKDQEAVVEQLKCNLGRIVDKGNRIIMAGDFNLNPKRVNDSLYSHRRLTSNLLLSLKEMGLERYSFGDTFCRTIERNTISSELDWLVSNQEMTNLCQEWHGLSDHSLVLWRSTLSQSQNESSQVLLRNLYKVDRKCFARDLSMQPWEIIGDVDLDINMMAEKFNTLFLEILNKHAPLRPVRKKKRQTPKPSSKLKKLRRQRDNARSKCNIVKLRQLRSQCNKLSQLEAVNFAKDRIQKNENNVWKIVNETLGKTGQTTNCNTITNDQGKALHMAEAACLFNDYFIQKIKKIQDSIPKSNVDPVQGAKKRALDLNLKDETFYLRTIQESDVEKAIRKSKASSCPDYFGISPASLKLAPEVVAVPLAWIINKVICTGTIPDCWKVARIIPLHKKKAKDKVENYRPVSILPSPSKIMEVIIQLQFNAYFENNNVLPSSQFGFRKGLSTVQATGAADHDWKQSRQDGLACGALFFDLSAAFDTIDLCLLNAKLEAYGAGNNVTAWTKSYLTGRRQCVNYGGNSSPIVNVTIGSPQGSVISPLLFLILVADIETWISKAKALSYADDTTVYYAAKSKIEVRRTLEVAANEVLTFMQASMLSANPSKTKYIMFGRQGEESLKVGDVLIEESKEEKLLGITFNKALSWSSHVDFVRTELKKRIGILRCMTFRLPVDIVKRMIQPIFTSKLMYGLALLASNQELLTENSLLKQLCLLHHRAMKVALRIRKHSGITYPEMLQRAGQKSVLQMALEQLSSASCKCLTPAKHPLIQGRLEEHRGIRTTRQSSRQWPPQSTKHSFISKLVEVWEQLPKNISQEQNCLKRKSLIQQWSARSFCDI